MTNKWIMIHICSSSCEYMVMM